MNLSRIDELEKRLAEAEANLEAEIQSERPRIISEIIVLIGKYRISAADLGFNEKVCVAVSPRKLPPKYQNPDDHGQSWAGKGTRPNWVKDHLSRGGTLNDLLIDKESSSGGSALGQFINQPIGR